MKRIIFNILIISFTLTSCNDWLSITPKTSIVAENHFKTEEGILQALNGAYFYTTNSYNAGGQMGGSGMLEGFTGPWNTSIPGSNLQALAEHDYSDSGLRTDIESTFRTLYKVVANINPLIEGIEEFKELYSDNVYKLVKAESHALRAYAMFDALRTWGPSPLYINQSQKYLPYPIENTKYEYDFLEFNEFIDRLWEDLEIAESFLEEVDPILEKSNSELNSTSGTWNYRQCHMNYYAVLGLKARIYQWLGQKEDALKIARIIKDAKNQDETPKFRLANMSDLPNKIPSEYSNTEYFDAAFFMEHIASLNLYSWNSNMANASGWGTPAGGAAISLTTDQYLKLEFDELDIRYKLYKYESTMLNTRGYVCWKYKCFSTSSTTLLRNYPLMRISEIYFMIMEMAELDEANDALRIFCESRGIEFEPFANVQDRNSRLPFEFMREFIYEGQNFFMYKRFGVENMFFTTTTWTPSDYQIPYIYDIIL